MKTLSTSLGLILLFIFSAQTSAATVHKIDSCAQLSLLSHIHVNLDGYYELLQDIDCHQKNLLPIGTPSHPFRGTLNGNGHVIKNLQIHARDHASGTALLGSVQGGYQVYNLALENITVNAVDGYKDNTVGAASGILIGEEIRSEVDKQQQAVLNNISIRNSTLVIRPSYQARFIAGAVAGIFGQSATKSRGSVVNIRVDGVTLKFQHDDFGYGTLAGAFGKITAADIQQVQISNTTLSNAFHGGGFAGLGSALQLQEVAVSNLLVKYFQAANSVGGLLGSVEDSSLQSVAVSAQIMTEGTRIGGVIGGGENTRLTHCSADISLVNLGQRAAADAITGIGGIIGISRGNLSIEQCAVRGRIDVPHSNGIGGVVGMSFAEAGTVKLSNLESAVKIMRAAYDVGGIIGFDYKGKARIEHAVVTGSLHADNPARVGAIAGAVVHRYNSENIMGPQVSNTFWNVEELAYDNPVGIYNNAYGIDTLTMQSASLFRDANFDRTVWHIVPGESPTLLFRH